MTRPRTTRSILPGASITDMSTTQSIGLRLFDATFAFQRRTPSAPAAQPLDALRALTQSLSQPDPRLQSGGSDSTLPDFLSAAAAAASVVRSASTTSPSGAFTVTRASSADPVHVTSLATAAHARSQGFSSLDDQVTAGALALSINGSKYTLNIAQGSTLKDVVAGVKALGAPISVAVDNDGGQLRLGITTRDTGYKQSGSAADALTISETDSGGTGKALDLAVDHQATNAVYTLHGVTRVSTDNHVSDAATGTTIDLGNSPSTVNTAAANQVSSLLQRGVVGTPVGVRVSIDSLASAAQVRSRLYDSTNAQVTSGTLSLNVEGKQYDVSIKDGDTLADVRRSVENSGAAVKATLVTDAGGVRLAIASAATGYPLRGQPADALTVTEKSTGSGGQALNPSVTQAASNASVTVDGSTISSRSNIVTGAIPGFTLNAQHVSSAAEIVRLPGIAIRPPINVENELNRVLQAQLLKPRDFGVTDSTNDSKKDDINQVNDPAKSTAVSRPVSGGTESSRRDILQKLTAVDDVFGGLKAAHTLLASTVSTATTTSPSTSAATAPAAAG